MPNAFNDRVVDELAATIHDATKTYQQLRDQTHDNGTRLSEAPCGVKMRMFNAEHTIASTWAMSHRLGIYDDVVNAVRNLIAVENG